MSHDDTSEAPKGIGGWLILVAIGIVVAPFKILFILSTVHVPIFRDGTLEYLTNPENDAYHPFWAPYIYGEVLTNGLILIASIYLIYLFFTKDHRFPPTYIFLQVFGLVFVIVDSALIKVVLPSEPVFDPETVGYLFGSTISLAIWVPYMLLSKRVKATFVENHPDKLQEGVVNRF